MIEFDYLGLFGNLPVTTPELVRELTQEGTEEKSDQEVNIIPAESISVLSPATKLQMGDALILSLTTEPEIANAPTVVWESSDPSIATVNADGLVIGRKAGDVDITATDPSNNKITSKVSLTITVEPVTTDSDDEEEETKSKVLTTEDGKQLVTEDTNKKIATE